MLKRNGLFLDGVVDGKGTVGIVASDFPLDEAEEIFAQRADYALLCYQRGRYDIVPVSTRRGSFLVLISAHRYIELPRLLNGEKGRTSDSKNIPAYVHAYSEEQRKIREKVRT